MRLVVCCCFLDLFFDLLVFGSVFWRDCCFVRKKNWLVVWVTLETGRD